MSDRRRLERKQTTYYFKVYDRVTGDLIGHAVDITSEGIMLISETPIKVKTTYALRLHFPFTLEGLEGNNHEIEFDARAQWCDKDINTGLFDTGFKFDEISSENVEKIKVMIEGYSFAGPSE